MPSDEQIESQIEALESERERLRQREGSADPTLSRTLRAWRRSGSIWTDSGISCVSGERSGTPARIPT